MILGRECGKFLSYEYFYKVFFVFFVLYVLICFIRGLRGLGFFLLKFLVEFFFWSLVLGIFKFYCFLGGSRVFVFGFGV